VSVSENISSVKLCAEVGIKYTKESLESVKIPLKINKKTREKWVRMVAIVDIYDYQIFKGWDFVEYGWFGHVRYTGSVLQPIGDIIVYKGLGTKF